MTGDYVLFLGVGRLLIYTGQKFTPNLKNDFLNKLLDCDFCLGVWVYTILALAFKINILTDIFYFPFLSELITGCASAFLMHLLVLGWKSKFEVIVIQ